MALTLIYGTRTAFVNNSATELDARSDGDLIGFGKIDNSPTATDAVPDYHIHLAIPVATAATQGGSWDVYLVESQDDTEWTDNISPTATSNQSAKLQNAKLIRSYEAGATGSATTTIRDHFSVAGFVVNMPKTVGFLMHNNSGQTATNGFDADHQALTFATL